MRYFLLGLPGSGKSYWGKKWSGRLKTLYFDLDELIENNEGFNVQEIFANEGEDHFRNLETFYLEKVIDNYQSFVLSTGGGTPCFNNNIEIMKNQGQTLYLDPPLQQIADRVWKPKNNKRPLFADCKNKSDAVTKLKELKATREPYYKQADVSLNKWDELTVMQLKLEKE